MNKLLLGVDLGTSSVKACVFDEKFNLISSGKAGYPTYCVRPAYAEQDPALWWSAAVKAIRKTVEESAGKGRVAAVSVSSQSPSLVPLDKEGRVIRNALIWMDRRAEAECGYLANELIGQERYRRILGAAPDAYYILPKLYWYKKNEEENYNKTSVILQTNGYINYMLTGERSIDLIHAISVQGMDVASRDWSAEISEIVDLPFKKLFPKISMPYEIIGQVNQKAAELTGLAEGTPVMAGATDTIAAYLGFGALSGEGAAEMTGTSTLLFFNTQNRVTDPGRLLLKPSPIDDDGKIMVAAVNATGGSVEWFSGLYKNEKGEPLSFAEMNRGAAKAKAGANGLLYFPYLAGERAPLWNNYARGMYIGLTYNTDRNALIRALYEGTCYAIRHNFDEAVSLGANPQYVCSAGGGTGSDIWLEIKASVLNRSLYVLNDGGIDRAALGNALLAGFGIGLIDDIKEKAKSVVKIKKEVKPNPKWVKTYNELYPYYIKMYQSLEKDLKEFSQTVFNL